MRNEIRERMALQFLSESLQDQKKLELRILVSGGIALLGALLISLILTHGLSIPLRELVTGTNEIRRFLIGRELIGT